MHSSYCEMMAVLERQLIKLGPEYCQDSTAAFKHTGAAEEALLTWLTSSVVSSPLLAQSSRATEPLETLDTTDTLSLNGVSSSDPLEPPGGEKKRF